MKFFTVLSFCFFAITVQAQLWDCDCDIEADAEWICAVDSTGEIHPVPNQCLADCFGLTVVDSIDCTGSDPDDLGDFFDWFGIGSTGAGFFDCDCDDDIESDGVCIRFPFPDSLLLSADTFDLIDIEFPDSLELWLPAICYAECLGLDAYAILDCDSIYLDWPPQDSLWHDWDWEDDWEWDDGCECDEDDWNGDGLCILVTLPDSLIGLTDSLLSGGGYDFPLTFEAWVPSECYAACWGYADYEIIECDSLWDDWEWEDDWEDDWEWDDGCECDEDDWNGDGLCILVTLPDSLIGLTDSLFTGSGLDFPLTFETWVPSECFAACWGYTDYEIVECDSLWDDWEWEDDWEDDWEWDDGCECDEDDWNGDGLCILVTLPDSLIGLTDSLITGSGLDIPLTFETWVPSECYAVCWGYTDYEIVECDSLWDDWEWEDDWDDDWEWDDGCECDEDDWNGDGLCILVTLPDSLIGLTDSLITGNGLDIPLTFETWVPSECYAACWGYTDYEIVECDSLWDDWEWEDDWDDDWDWDDGCECDEDDLEGDGICILVSLPDSLIDLTDSLFIDLGLDFPLTFETWVPSECYAECWGYTDYEIIDCDSIIYIDPWEDCDCEYSEEDEPVCVLTDTATGEICPFPNLCYAECAGYTIDDVVDCESMMDFECLECFEEEVDPVCVTDSTGLIFPVPNLCIAECLGLQVVDDGSCGGFTDGGSTEELDWFDYTNVHLTSVDDDNISGFNIYPNPSSDMVNMSLMLSADEKMTVNISDLQGRLINTYRYNLNRGMNNISIEISNLETGSYLMSVSSDKLVFTERFIKI